MSFTPPPKNNQRIFNNADSFAIEFDEAWKSFRINDKNEKYDRQSKLKMVLDQIKDHPFLIEFPDQALAVAQFRIRLLNLL